MSEKESYNKEQRKADADAKLFNILSDNKNKIIFYSNGKTGGLLMDGDATILATEISLMLSKIPELYGFFKGIIEETEKIKKKGEVYTYTVDAKTLQPTFNEKIFYQEG